MAWLDPEDVEFIVVHASDTPADMDIGVAEIDRWHRQRGFLEVGYHYVIRRSGEWETGRDDHRPGAHARGFNHKSIAVCLVGGRGADGEAENNFTDDQMDTLEGVVLGLESVLPHAKVVGHRDLPGVTKACPCFDAAEWLQERRGNDG